MHNLVIVESPAKAKTIEKFLGKDFKVVASYGHVRDLPKSELGIDTEKNFNPKYIIPTKSRKKVNELKKIADKSDQLYLATDLDREGEAIAWHIAKVTSPKNMPKRVVFSEITKDAILDAFKNSRDLNMDLVDAQQARRILDRLVGYKLSPLLWKKIKRGLSAGRVQSIALRFIVDRERDVQGFKPQEYWQIEAELSKKIETNGFFARLHTIEGKRVDKLDIKNEKEASKITKNLDGASFSVVSVEKKQRIKNPNPPFITSTLQQESSRRLGFSAKKTMLIAQQLYEGINVGEQGQVGLITYMRTDSLNLSNEFLNKTLSYIEKKYGAKYKKEGGRRFKAKTKLAQEAHEAIRPTEIERDLDFIKQFLNNDQYKLYSLIYSRALASQMTEAIFDVTSVKIKALSYGFLSSGSIQKFDGFLRVIKDAKEQEDQKMPKLEENEELNLVEIKKTQSFTNPPARYSEASLVKTLEENGIGRPSTYAPIMSTIIDRGYVQKEKGYFIPLEIGFIVNDFLVDHFPDIFDVKFTAHIEEELDDIAKGKIKWPKVISEFYSPFDKNLEAKHEEVEKIKLPEVETDIKCEKCEKPMVIKLGRFGKFLACSGFPECKNTRALDAKEVNVKCPRCGDNLKQKRTRRGKIFYGCAGYPSCSFATWDEPLEDQCKKCGSLLIKNKKDEINCIDCDLEPKK